MKTCFKKPVLIFPAVLFVIFSAINLPADEIGVATGLNTTVYRFKSQEITYSEYQKTDILNPITIAYQKDFTGFFGIHSALQYSKRSNSKSVQHTEIDENGNPIFLGTVKYEDFKNYLSLEISPIFFHQFNQILLDARSGVSGDFSPSLLERFLFL